LGVGGGFTQIIDMEHDVGQAQTPLQGWVQFVETRYVPLRESQLLEAGFADLVARMQALSEAMDALQERLGQVEECLAAQPRCRQALLYDLGAGKYELKQPLAVQLEEYDDEAVARIPELDVFASATTDSEALVLLKAEVVSLYDELASCPPEELGERPIAWLRLLKRLINIAEAP
jgi:hypothetical protein